LRTYVTFQHPAPFVRVSDDDGILSVNGADWFVSLLSHVGNLELGSELCQEDWGIVAFAERAGKKFWIGLSWWEEGAWVAHFHHASWAWLQRFSPSGARELQRLVDDFHQALAHEPAVGEITWHREDDLRRPTSSSA
jgi:hypothetical protein